MADQCHEKIIKEDSKTKKSNLMSIIDSLHSSSTHSNPTQPNGDEPSSSDASNLNLTQTMETNFPLKVERELDIGMAPESFRPLSPEINQERDVLENVLKLLTQANNMGNIADSSQTSNAEDETILEMQQPSNSGVQLLLSSVANGTNQVKSILKNDVNIIYECKRCRGMFRALPNLIRHKKEYCKNTGVLSSFMNRDTNSTAEEDAGFQTILNTLHPPDNPFSQNPQLFTNSYPQQYHTPSPAMYGATANSAFTASVPAPKIGPSTANRYIISNDSSSLPMTYRKPVSSSNNPSSSTAPQKKVHPCPVCKRELSDRKSVRRHLIHIHGMSVMEAIKVTHSGPPRNSSNNATTTRPRTPVKKPVKRVYQHSGNLQEISIEIIDVGNDRKIYVLPEDFAISSSECPVCARTLCRRTNVRRHLLEAHQFIIKGERKYHQLKDIVGNKIPGSPSLRNLRNVGVLSESLNSLKNSEKEKNADAKALRDSGNEASAKKEKTVRTTTAEEVTNKKLSPIVSNNNESGLDASTTSTTNTIDKKSESEVAPSSKEVMVVSKVLNTNNNSVQNIKTESAKDESTPNDVTSVSATVDTVLDLSPYKCPECTKTFTRRQTFKNHMFSFHKCSEKKFEGMFGGTDGEAQATDKESSKELKKTSVKKERRRSNDEEPPRKIRKSDLRHLFTKLPSVQNSAKNERVSATVQEPVINATAPKCFTLIPVNANENVLKSPNTILIGNGTNFFQNGTAGNAKPILLKPLSTSSSPIAPTTIRPFIQVKLSRSIVATKTMKANSTVSPKQVNIIQSKTPIASVPRTKKQMYDIAKKTCYACEKVFESSQEVKAHLMQLHSLSHEDALTYSAECSNVRPEDQEAGIENGFDILSAKCLICNRLYFSRTNLTKHMLKFHHIMPDKLKGLAVPEALSKSRSSQGAVQTTAAVANFEEKKPSPSSQHKLRNVRKSVTAEKPSRNSRVNPTDTPPKITLNGNCFAVSEESVLRALEKFPKDLLNVQNLRCLRCKHKYKKMWDLKIHLLRHVGLGLFACKHCPKPSVHMTAVRSIDVLKHLQISHGITITNKNRNHLISQCRINNEALWDAYNIPLKKR